VWVVDVEEEWIVLRLALLLGALVVAGVVAGLVWMMYA